MAPNINRQTPEPLHVPRSRRNQSVAVLTSSPAGKCLPFLAIPMLREDAMSGAIDVTVEMAETTELLMNPVNCRITAYCVPLLALERFEGSRDMFDRSYMGQPKIDGGAVVPFIETHAMGALGSKAVYKALGLHAKSTDLVNTAYLEAYNCVWNYRAKNRSPLITPRTRLDDTLAPAFWQSGRFEHVVPDFDQAVIDGQVALNVVNAKMPVKGLGITAHATTAAQAGLLVSGNVAPVSQTGWYVEGAGAAPAGPVETLLHVQKAAATAYPDIYAELATNGITVSLSNIEMARRTQAFARLREQYQGYDDEYLIDLLMAGISLPDQALKMPMLIFDRTVSFGQMKRYATDAGNLAESAVSGGARIQARLRCPRISTGAVVIVQLEAFPEQLFERQAEPFFRSTDAALWPEFVRDSLDPEKVDVIRNDQVDSDHATPAATFGYAPMNWQWSSFGPRIGGKFYRPTTNTGTDDARQRLWALENVNPVLGADFYLVKNIHQKPFLDITGDPFELTAMGNVVVDGNSVFGPALVEASNNYAMMTAEQPTTRIVKP